MALIVISGFIRQGKTIQHFGSNYTFHAKSVQWHTWEESRRGCKETGGELVSIESLEEWKFLKNTIQTMKGEQYFIGLRKDGKSGEWRWMSDNSTANATKGTFPWAKNEPNGDGHCAVMYKDYMYYFGGYNDLSCTAKMRSAYICESPAQSNGNEGGMSHKLYTLCCLLLIVFLLFCQVINNRPGIFLVL